MNLQYFPKAILADDEPLLLTQLERELSKAWPELAIAATAQQGAEALSLIDELQPDVVFLDIQMPAPNGLEVARQLAQQVTPPLVVFVTAYNEFALQAFEAAAVDYLTKPLNPIRLQQTVARLQARLAPVSAPLSGQAHLATNAQQLARLMAHLSPLLSTTLPVAPLKWLKAAVGNTVRFIAVDEVLYFEAADKYVQVVTASGEALIRTPLKELLTQLDADQFWQIHRSIVVNMAQVQGAVRDTLGRLTVQLKHHSHSLPVSRAFVHLFKQM